MINPVFSYDKQADFTAISTQIQGFYKTHIYYKQHFEITNKTQKTTTESNTFIGFVPYETTITADTYVYGTLYEDWVTTAIINKIPSLVGFYLQKYAKNSVLPLPPLTGDSVIPPNRNPCFSKHSTT